MCGVQEFAVPMWQGREMRIVSKCSVHVRIKKRPFADGRLKNNYLDFIKWEGICK